MEFSLFAYISFFSQWIKLSTNTANLFNNYQILQYKKLHDHTNNILELSLKNGSEWYITSWLNNNSLAITIYGNRNKSHDHKSNIFELSLKNGSKWYTTSLVGDNSLVITIYSNRNCESLRSKTRSLSVQNLVTFFIDSFIHWLIDSLIIWTAAKYF